METRPRLTDYIRYADARAEFSAKRLSALFDGNREWLNISHECVDRHAGARVALRIAHADGSDRTITFRELSTASARFAHYLGGRGVQPGDRVGIMLEPSPVFYAALFGIMKLGAIAVPLFTLFGTEALRMRIDDCGLRLLFVASDRLALAPEFPGVELIAADENLLAGMSSFPETFASRTRPNDLAMYQYTSGTTRQLPEAIKHTHRAVVIVVVAALYGTGVRPSDRFFVRPHRRGDTGCGTGRSRRLHSARKPVPTPAASIRSVYLLRSRRTVRRTCRPLQRTTA